MTRSRRTALTLVGALATALTLGGCATEHLSADFGKAVRQNIAAQIANPDAKFTGAVAPGSNPARVAAAQDRYVKGKVIAPASQSTSSAGTSGSGSSGSGASGSGASATPAT